MNAPAIRHGAAAALIIILTLTAPIRADAPARDLHAHEEARIVMGTLARVSAWASTPSAAEDAVHAAFTAFDRVDGTFSTWNPDSELSRLNRRAGAEMVPVSDDMMAMIRTALDLAERSRGAFDPTVLPLVRLWGFREDGPAAVPDSTAVARCLDSVGYERIVVDERRRRIGFAVAGMALDFGGLAKGVALDRAAADMRSRGATGGLLDLGGGVYRFGVGAPYGVSVVDPTGRADSLGDVVLSEGAAATSGQYERFREGDGDRWGHIIDPTTGYPCDRLLGVTVLAGAGAVADAASTAAFVLGLERGLAFIESLPDCEAVFVRAAPSGGVDIRYSSGLTDAAPAGPDARLEGEPTVSAPPRI